jgi:hypothetical protein
LLALDNHLPQPPYTAKMAADHLIEEEDDQYASSEDSDFAPDDAPGATSDQSDDEEDGTRDKKRKQSEPDQDAQDEGYDNSGDEAIISKGNKRRKRAVEKGRPVDDDEGGEGGLIKTRAQRALE